MFHKAESSTLDDYKANNKAKGILGKEKQYDKINKGKKKSPTFQVGSWISLIHVRKVVFKEETNDLQNQSVKEQDCYGEVCGLYSIVQQFSTSLIMLA